MKLLKAGKVVGAESLQNAYRLLHPYYANHIEVELHSNHRELFIHKRTFEWLMFPTGKVAKYCIFSTKSRAVLYGDNKHEKIPKAIQKVNKIGVQLARFDQNLLDKFKPFGHSRDISAILSHLRKTSQYDYNFPRQHGHALFWKKMQKSRRIFERRETPCFGKA